MRKYWLLLLFMTIGMGHFGFNNYTVRVTSIDHGIVTMRTINGEKFQIEEAESWQIGDKAEVITGPCGMVVALYSWRK